MKTAALSLLVLATTAFAPQVQSKLLKFNSTIPAISTENEAVEAAVKASENDPNLTLNPDETVKAVGFYYLNSEKAGFAKEGDRLWQVHFIRKGTFFVTKIAWVNADTEQVIFIFPDKLQASEQESTFQTQPHDTTAHKSHIPHLAATPIRMAQVISVMGDHYKVFQGPNLGHIALVYDDVTIQIEGNTLPEIDGVVTKIETTTKHIEQWVKDIPYEDEKQ